MHKKMQILSMILSGCLGMSCAKTSSSSNSAGKAAAGSSTGTSSTINGLSSLESLLGGLAGSGTNTTAGTGTGTGASADAEWASEFGDPFLSFQIYDLQLNYLNQADLAAGKSASTYSDVFDCPGDSMLVGFRGLYDTTKGDRQMQPYCQFIDDGSGTPMVKKTCSVVNGIASGVNSTAPFLCPSGTFLSGFRGTWDSTKMDRSYQFECCQLANASGTLMSFVQTSGVPECENSPGATLTQANHNQGVLDNHCQGSVPDPSTGQMVSAATVVQSIFSSMIQTKSVGTNPVTTTDRIWSFQCCSIGINAPAAQ